MTNEKSAEGHHHAHGNHSPEDCRDVLKDPERLRWLPPEPLLQEAGFASGSTVLDIGAGTGFWTAPLAALVGPEGRVIAVDIEPIMLDELRALIAEKGLQNVDIVQSDEVSIPLPDRVADSAVLGFMLHHPPDPAAFLREVRRLLKPGARVLSVDWHKHETEQGPPLVHRLSDEETCVLLSEAGFSVCGLKSPTDDVHVLLAFYDEAKL
jgi:ubiquinone/menaquinone biosynthesis C-methylase UbiE